MELEKFVCHICKKTKETPRQTVETGTGGSGYAIDAKDNKICYDCCAEQDKAYMRHHGKITLYLSIQDNKYVISNWPNTLKIPVSYYRKGQHNIAGTRYDVWFRFENHMWHGVQYGEMTQLCHCKRTKEKY